MVFGVPNVNVSAVFTVEVALVQQRYAHDVRWRLVVYHWHLLSLDSRYNAVLAQFKQLGLL
jgi:hypothetical protein